MEKLLRIIIVVVLIGIIFYLLGLHQQNSINDCINGGHSEAWCISQLGK